MNQTKAIIKPAKAPHTFDNVKKILIRYSKRFTLSARASHLTSIKNTSKFQLRGSEPRLFTFLTI